MVNIFTTVLVKDIILPFILVFIVVFSILQKTKLLGEKKAQADSLVALAVALLLVATPAAREFIVKFTPWVSVGLIVILVFILLYGFLAGDSWKDQKGLKTFFGVVAGIFVIVLVVYFSGLWDLIASGSLFSSSDSSGFWGNAILIAVVIGVVALVIFQGKEKDKEGK